MHPSESMHPLEELVLNDWDLELPVLSDIQVLPRLKTLSLRIHTLGGSCDHSTGMLHFPKLEALDVSGNATQLVDLLKTGIRPQSKLYLQVQLQPFEKSNFGLDAVCILFLEASTQTNEFLDTLSVKINHSSLVYVDSVLQPAVLSPIYHFRHLKQLVINSRVPFCYQDGDVEQIIRSFPYIEHLDLCGSYNDIDYESNISPRILVTFAKKCQYLKHLSIFLSSDWKMVKRSALAPAFRSTSQIKTLDLGPSRLDNRKTPQGMKNILIKIFPKLCNLAGSPQWTAVDCC
ncbi:hypothetical protein FRC02_010895 [Tulasnella sp. 418]|nr:hypothetical protein FRC02_010895 [Tulasnella sp. 418]